MATISEIAKRFEVSNETVKLWTSEFAEHFSLMANPKKYQPRQFCETDLRILMLISDHWSDDPDLEEIHDLLNSHQHDGDWYVDAARLQTPIFQDVPDEIDESWQHGCLISGMASRDWLSLARSYKLAGDVLVAQIMSRRNEPHDFDYPVIYLYRHSVELYLKTLLNESSLPLPPKGGHNIETLVRSLEAKAGKPVKTWVKDRLLDFHRIDIKSDVFRYPEDIHTDELWIDFHQLKTVMNRLAEAFEDYLFNK